jgi:hypothetical protein
MMGMIGAMGVEVGTFVYCLSPTVGLQVSDSSPQEV